MTPLPEASPAPVSEAPPVSETPVSETPAAGAAAGAAPETGWELICPAAAIVDAVALDARLDRAARDNAGDGRALRAAAVPILAAARLSGTGAIEAAFAEAPRAARGAVTAYAWLTDVLVRATLRLATKHLHPLGAATEAERLAVLGVGGYGRGEMAPHSDVDLLFLTPYKVTPWAESVIESMLYILWDLRLKVGHSSRTVKDCLRLGQADYTIRTALLENRFVGGDRALADELSDRLWRELFRATASDFI